MATGHLLLGVHFDPHWKNLDEHHVLRYSTGTKTAIMRLSQTFSPFGGIPLDMFGYLWRWELCPAYGKRSPRAVLQTASDR